jgi:hypothetical protein
MTTSRVPFIAALIVAGVLVVQSFVSIWLSYLSAALTPGVGLQGFPVLEFFLNDVTRIIAFGIGVFLSLRFFAPIHAGDRWGRVIGRGFIAALVGTAVVFVVAIIWAILAAIHISAYPFGYSVDPSIDGAAVGNNVLLVFNAILNPLVEWFPIVVLATVLSRVWLARQPDATESVAVARDTVSAKG